MPRKVISPEADLEPDDTGSKQAATQFKPGVSGNPSGRPKGSRNRLSEAFINVLEDSFEREGVGVINRLMKDDPKSYTKIIAQLCPAKLEMVVDHTHHLDHESISGVLETVAREAGVEAAKMLASMFGIVMSEAGDVTKMKLLPPADVSPFDEETQRADHRNWLRKRHFDGFHVDEEDQWWVK
jgi:hypothetical protein